LFKILRATFIALFLSCVILLAFFNYIENSLCRVFPCAKGLSSTTSKEFVDLTSTSLVRQVHFRIPKAYLSYKKQQQGGEHGYIYLEALLPDFRPWSHRNSSYPFLPDIKPISTIPAKSKEFAKENRIYLKLTSGLNYGSGRRWQKYLAEYKKVKKITDDLYLYKDKKYDRWDYIAPLNQDISNTIYFRCWALCKAHTNLQKDVSIQYSFDKKYLKHWAEIDKQVKKFSNDFVVSAISYKQK
jgi:hypothetical protein